MTKNTRRSDRNAQTVVGKAAGRSRGRDAMQSGVGQIPSAPGKHIGLDPTMNAMELARYLDLTRQRVTQLTAEAVLTRNIDGKYPQNSTRVAYIRYLRSKAASRAATGNKTTGLIETKTLKAKLDLAVAQGEYVKIHDVEAVLTEAFTSLRNELAGLGASVTRNLQLRAEIDESVNERISRVRVALEAAASVSYSDREESK